MFNISIFNQTCSIISIQKGTGEARIGSHAEAMYSLKDFLYNEFGLVTVRSRVNLFAMNNVKNNCRVLAEMQTLLALHDNKYQFTLNNKQFTLRLLTHES